MNKEQTFNSESQQQSFISIFYKTFMGKEGNLLLSKSTSLQQLTNTIGTNIGQNPEQLQLYNLGKIISCKHKSLSQYGLENNSIINVSVILEQFENNEENITTQRSRVSSLYQPTNSKIVTLWIKFGDNNTKMQISKLHSVSVLKIKIQQIYKIQVQNIRLFYENKQLANNKTLQECGIDNFAILKGEQIISDAEEEMKLLKSTSGQFSLQASIKSKQGSKISQNQDVVSEKEQSCYLFMTESDQCCDDNKKCYIRQAESLFIQDEEDNQIPYFFWQVDNNNNQSKVYSSFDNKICFKDCQVAKKTICSLSQRNQEHKPIQVKNQKWIGPCEIKIQNITKTINFTIFLKNSQHSVYELRQFIQKRMKITQLQLLNPFTYKPFKKHIFIYALPWQSTIVNGVLCINLKIK